LLDCLTMPFTSQRLCIHTQHQKSAKCILPLTTHFILNYFFDSFLDLKIILNRHSSSQYFTFPTDTEIGCIFCSLDDKGP